MLGRKIKKLKNWLQNRHNLQLFRLRLAEDRQKTALYRAVLISHELSATGAPLMLLAAAEAILADGGSVRRPCRRRPGTCWTGYKRRDGRPGARRA